MSNEIQFEGRMSDGDALMWHIERDPILRTTIAVVWILDQPPDWRRLEEMVERTTRKIPRLRQRVAFNRLSLAPPRWEVDPDFDLSFHLRRAVCPGAGTLRDLLDMAQPMAMHSFDRDRPLWEMVVVEGLQEGRAAILMKLHHCLTDGVGLVRMTNGMIERARERDPASEAKPMPALPELHYMSMAERFLDALAFERNKQTTRARRAWSALSGQLDELVRNPADVARGLTAALGSAGRLLKPISEPMSPIMRERSSRWRFDTLTIDFQALKKAARAAGGTLNDAFVAGVLGGMRLYHEARGAPVETLRMAMPINLRSEETEQKAGNHFAPVRFLVPVGVTDPVARMRAVHELVSEQRAEPALPIIDDLSSLLNRLPVRLTTALFGSMVKAVDFYTSNVPGPPFDVFVSGARLESIFGFGPLGGSAVNITLFSYRGQLEIAVNTDRAAVPDPELFVRCLSRGMDEVLATGS